MSSKQWITRKGTKERGFSYAGPDGRRVRDRATLERIDMLRIPPAWRDVHISRNPRSPIQVWGFDARGRKQYRYHLRAVEKGELRKHHRVRQMATDLPRMRRAMVTHFRRKPAHSRERVCAGIVRLIAWAHFRVGSERYEKENNTFGITTLRKSHVTIAGDTVSFEYPGKRGIRHRQIVIDPDTARFVQSLLRSPGPRLFRYKAHGRWVDVTSHDVNEYIEEVAGFPYTAKDFRTWNATFRAALTLAELGDGKSSVSRRKNVLTAVRAVAWELGNTPAICRKSYVHPVVITRYLKSGATISLPRKPAGSPGFPVEHTGDERALLAFLRIHFKERRRRRRAA